MHAVSLHYYSVNILFCSETFSVEDAVEAIGFGKFQWKLSLLTGVAWVKFVFFSAKNFQITDNTFDNSLKL